MAFVGFIQLTTEQINIPSQYAGEMPIGTIGADRRGNLYSWSLNGAVALNQGQVTIAQAKVSNHTNLALDTTSPTAIGSKNIVVDAGGTTITQQQYAGGYAVVNDGTGAGQTLQITSNGASSSTTGPATINFHDQLFTALDNTSKVSLMYNPWSGVIVNPGSSAAFFCTGAPETPVTAGYYYWSKVRGMASLLSDASVPTKGAGVIISPGTAGAVTIETASTVTQRIGVAPEAVVSAKYYGIYLTIV